MQRFSHENLLKYVNYDHPGECSPEDCLGRL